MEEEMLPEGWVWATLQDLGEIVSGGTPKTSMFENFDGDVAWITPADLTGYTAKRIARGRRNLSAKGLRASSARLLPARSVVFSSRAPIGYVAIAANELATNQGFKSIAVSPHFDEEYLYYYLLSAKQLAEQNASGTTFKEISKSRFARLPIPVAPLNEQRRIVDKIDTLFAELDQGEAELRKVQILLARYRQSVLKAAVTGELTADWRARNADHLESGHDLLARILDVRRQNWQGRGKYKEPVAPDTTDLPELPEGWIWATVEQLASCDPYALAIGPFGSNLKVSDYRDEGVPLVFVRNIRAKDFEGLAPKFVSKQKAEELSAHTVQPGDLLVTKMGDPPGDVCIYPENQEVSVITADCIRFATHSAVVSSYVEIAISSQVVQRQIQKISKGVAQQKVTLAGFKKIVLPLPPREEQDQINAMVHELFDEVSSMALNCQSELTRSAALRQSILKDAFAGKLVPQNPDDEPASALLARIRAEREAISASRK